MEKRRLWKAEECEWLRDNIENFSYRELTIAFNKRFNRNLSVAAVEHKCARLGIDHGKKFKFEKGKNNPCSMALPIGGERISAGKVYVKVADAPIDSGGGRLANGGSVYGEGGNFVQKNRYVYEQHYGSIPKGYMIVSLVNDRNNFEPQNLYATTRAVNMMMCQNNWYTENREHTLTAIKYCELQSALKERINE